MGDHLGKFDEIKKIMNFDLHIRIVLIFLRLKLSFTYILLTHG